MTSRIPAGSLLAACALAACPPVAAEPVGDAREPPLRGIVISTHGVGEEWGDPETMDATMLAIRETGANWVAYHPYARIEADGRLDWSGRDGTPPEAWTEPIRAAHRAGLKIAVKPHVAYWGSPFRWRGEIDFADDGAAWERFWTAYATWIVLLARECRGADGMFVGTELDRTLRFEDRWRDLIARVRAVTDAPLSYAANWDRYRDVGFWDALDAVGIQAYFPLSDRGRPSRTALAAAWNLRTRELKDFSRSTGRRIVFAELGYSRRWAAAAEPWVGRPIEEDAAGLQAALIETAIRAAEREPAIDGLFLWKWFPEPHPIGRDFRVADPEIRALLRDLWASPSDGRTPP